MNNKRYNIVAKGFYNHSQSNACIFIKQYIIAEEVTKKLLLLRFWNASDFEINGMELILTQIGADGEELGTSVVKIDGLKIGPAETYTTNQGIVISDKCVDFRVVVKYVRSGSYEYYQRGGKIVPKYNPQLPVKKRSRDFGRAFIRKQKAFLGSAAAFTAVILILVIVIGVYIYARIC